MFVNRERLGVYPRLILNEMVLVGTDSLPIVGIVSVFVGAVSLVQTAYNLISPLIPNYVIALVVRDMTVLELSPTVLVLILAGRVGSNIAGTLGTMRIREQVDALEVMGVNSTSYLVLPKVIACVVMFPLLVILSMFLSLLGGYLAGVYGDILTTEEYVRGIRDGFSEFVISFALIKATTFAFLTASISAYKGYYTKGGALEVGKSSTEAVTSSSIAILCADYLLAQLFL